MPNETNVNTGNSGDINNSTPTGTLPHAPEKHLNPCTGIA